MTAVLAVLSAFMGAPTVTTESRLRDRMIFGTLFGGVAWRLAGHTVGDDPVSPFSWPLIAVALWWCGWFALKMRNAHQGK